jgi:hypothetical protein
MTFRLVRFLDWYALCTGTAFRLHAWGLDLHTGMTFRLVKNVPVNYRIQFSDFVTTPSPPAVSQPKALLSIKMRSSPAAFSTAL